MTDKMRGNMILLVTAMIWGTAFVAQSTAMDHIAPFTYNGIRTLIGGIALLPLVFILESKKQEMPQLSVEEQQKRKKHTITGGVICGVVLCAASSFQQFGISMTTAGKAGFITALYVVFVPIIGVLIGGKIPKKIWLCVAIAIIGFWLLCVKEGFSVGKGDWLVLVCAIVFSVHILVVDQFTAKGVDVVKMSCIQFFVAGILMLVGMLIFETPVWSAILDAKWSILYAGVLSCGAGYTLQMVGQKYTDPTIATLIMSLESVFSAIAGWLILNEQMSGKEIIGCILVFAAVLLAQVPVFTKRGRKNGN